jgi:3-phytase
MGGRLLLRRRHQRDGPEEAYQIDHVAVGKRVSAAGCGSRCTILRTLRLCALRFMTSPLRTSVESRGPAAGRAMPSVSGALVLTAAFGCAAPEPAAPAANPPAAPAVLAPVGRTASLPHDADDPAIWIHPTDPSRSLIFGTDKEEKAGGLYAFGLDGALRLSIAPLDRPNNVDVEYGFRSAGATLDIAVVTERMQHRLRIFGIAGDGVVTDLAPAGLEVLGGEDGEASEPMGIALYKRPADGAVFAIVAPKTGGATGYLWQYRLQPNAAGHLQAAFVRRFGRFGRPGGSPDVEIEAVVVDDRLGFVYYSDEAYGIRKYHADPDHPDAGRELAVLGIDSYEGDREGLAIYETGDQTGFLVSSDQVSNGSRLRVYRREGTAGNPHDQPELRTIQTTADDTDGLEVTSRPLPGRPHGMLVMMNAGPRNFLLYDWRDVAAALGPGDQRR